MDLLHRQTSHPLQQHQIEEFEQPDEELCSYMETDELSCRKIHMRSVPWSPTYKNVSLEIEYCRMRRSYHLGLHINVRQLIILQRKLNYKYKNDLSLPEIENKIRSVYKKRKKIKNTAISISLEYIGPNWQLQMKQQDKSKRLNRTITENVSKYKSNGRQY